MENVLRKSIPSISDLSVDNFERIISSDFISVPITEKTDGFAFQVGADSSGFYCASGTSPRMKNFGDFGRWGYKKNNTDFDPLISGRLDFALNLIKSNQIFMEALYAMKIEVSGELMLIIDGTPFIPNRTTYTPSKLGSLGTFIIHTRLPQNWNISIPEIEKLIKATSNTLLVDHDVHFYHPRINVDIRDIRHAFSQLDIKELKKGGSNLPNSILQEKTKYQNMKTRLEKQLSVYRPRESKWGTFPEGFILHFENGMKIKMMTVR